MKTPMSDERLAEIRERAESVKTWKGYHAEPVPQLLDVDVPALLAEVDRLRERLQESDNLLVGAHLELCKALGVRHRPLLDVIQHAATVRAERDRLAEQVKRVREVAAYFRDCETHLKGRCDQATNDAQATALLSSAALTGDAARRIERALDGTEAGR